MFIPEYTSIMSRNYVTKQELKAHVHKLKMELYHHHEHDYAAVLANMYLNKVLDKLEEYRD